MLVGAALVLAGLMRAGWFAALNILDGTIIGRNMQRHHHQEFIRFLNTIEQQVPVGKVIHAIVDNYATHTHPKVRQWLARHPPLDVLLHPDISVLTKRGRRLLRQAHAQAPQARRVPICPQRQTPIPNPSYGPPTQNASSPLSNVGSKR